MVDISESDEGKRNYIMQGKSQYEEEEQYEQRKQQQQ